MTFTAKDNALAQQRDRLAATEAQIRQIPSRFGSENPLYRYVTQTAHGFDIGDVVYHDGIDWRLCTAAEPGVIVASVPHPNAFVYAKPGATIRLPGLIAGTTYFNNSGALAAYDWVRSHAGQIVLHATSANEGIVLSYWRDDMGTTHNGIVGIYELPSAWGIGTPLANNGSIVRANASAIATSRVWGVISGALKAGSGSNLWYVVRNSGPVGGDDLLGHAWISPFDVPGFATGTYYLGTSDGTVTTTAPSAPNLSVRVLEAPAGGSIEIVAGAISPIRWDAINDKPTAYPPSGTISLTVDNTDVTDSPSLTFSGTIGAQVWTLYEKRPRFNAKWLLGAELATAVGSVSGSSEADLFLWWDKTNSKWSTFEWFPGTRAAGDLNVYDPAAGDTNAKMSTVAAGTACSVFGRSANSVGLPGAIAAAANSTVLLRRSDALTWAKVRAAEMDSQQTTGKYIIGTDSSGNCQWLTGEDARDNFDLANLKCFRGASQGDTVVYGKADPASAGTGTRLLLSGDTSEPSTATGTVLAQRTYVCSHWYFGSQVVLERPNYALFTAMVAFDAGLRVADGQAIAFRYGTSGSTSDTYIEKDKIYTNKVYAASMYPADGYTGTVSVRNAAGTGSLDLTFQNGILTNVA